MPPASLQAIYKLHRASNGIVPFDTWCVLPPNRDSEIHLYVLLQEWAGPKLEINRALQIS
jgi:hypothetical protein